MLEGGGEVEGICPGIGIEELEGIAVAAADVAGGIDVDVVAAAAVSGVGVGSVDLELKIGLGCCWNGSRMFKNADTAWTGPQCCA